MNKTFKATVIAAALFLSPAIALANDVPVTVFPSAKSVLSVPNDKIISLVREKIKLPPSDYQQVKVQIVYNAQNKPDYLLVYLLAAKTYAFTVTQIKINEKFEALTVTPHYRLQKQDYYQQPRAQIKFSDLKCPSKNIEFISATPVGDYPTAKAAVVSSAIKATLYGYKARTLLNGQATVKNYLNYLSCPSLKGFYNVGHGSPDGIMLADGVLSNDEISEQLKGKLGEHTVVLFNSCEVFNDPLKPALIEDADAQKYAGGITTLYIGPSELASRCFWDSAFKHQDMTPMMEHCNKKFDSEDQFGIDGHGDDTLKYPGRSETV